MDRKTFFDACRAGVMGPTLDQNEVSGADTLLTVLDGMPLAHVAYCLATAWHETAHTMQPVKERGGDAYFFRMYDPAGQRPMVAKRLGNTERGDGVRFCGRGYVQLTGRANYARAERELGVPLVASPDLAMGATTAGKIMRIGMTEGWFTGKRLADYLPASGPANRAAFIEARRIINGQDRAEMIADYAGQFQAALLAGGWQ